MYVAGYQDKWQIMAVMCGSLVGELLTFQLAHGGKTNSQDSLGPCTTAYMCACPMNRVH